MWIDSKKSTKEKKENYYGRIKNKFWHFFIVAVIFFVGYFLFISNRLTYVETNYLSFSPDNYITINSNTNLQQKFTMPYDLLKGISIKIGTFARDNNSKWKITVTNSLGDLVFNESFNASEVQDGSYFIVDLERPVQVHSGEEYFLNIIPKSVNSQTSLAFYTSAKDDAIYKDYTASVDNIDTDRVLSMAVIGGNKDVWWNFAYIVLTFFLIAFYLRFLTIKARGLRLKDDLILRAFCLTVIILILCLPFTRSSVSVFTDEFDNIRGGTLISNGEVLYRDYVTQHTPFTYYLCGVFAAFGAKSVQQFRLCFLALYMFFCFIGYLRYSTKFGVRRMFVFPIIATVVDFTIIGVFTQQVLSDNVQRVCMSFLLLEFLLYLREHSLNWGNCIIISIAVWASISSAFISIYALFIIFIGVVIIDIRYWRNNVVSIKRLLNHYYKLVVCLIIPPVAGITYLKMNGALGQAYFQAYLFNREVYPNYTGGFGDTILYPLYSGIQSMFTEFVNGLNKFGTENFTVAIFLEIIVFASLIAVAIRYFLTNKSLLVVYLIVFACVGATRGITGFHSIVFWDVAVLLICLYSDFSKILFDKKFKVAVVLFSCYMVQPSLNLYINAFNAEDSPVSYNESFIVEMTDPGEELLIDTGTMDSIYLLYKGRYPASRLTYFLPWYMDWYEGWTVEDLQSNVPSIVVWNKNSNVWGYQNFCNSFSAEVHEFYKQWPDGNSIIWIRK